MKKLHYTTAETLAALLNQIDDHRIEPGFAHIYGFEVGSVVKIGLSSTPKKRLRGWINLYESIGIDVQRALLTVPIASAKQHEDNLHQAFRDRKKPGKAKEFFSIAFQELLDEIDQTEVIEHHESRKITSALEIGTGPSGFLSLTSIWRHFGANESKTPARWAQNPSAQGFLVQARLNKHILSKLGRRGATYAHPYVAIAYAEYLGGGAPALVREQVSAEP
jgi:hypothetical protein